MDTISSLNINVFEENSNMEAHLVIIEQSMNQAILKKFMSYHLNLEKAFDISLTQLNANKDWIQIIAEIEVQTFGFTTTKGILTINRLINQSKWECIMHNLSQIVSSVCDLIQLIIEMEVRAKGFPNKMFE
ncbi:MAG: hypothetical protein OXC92_06485 [Flavobacteriaceae bacterium]|nr:hypothetical protein [Flavobacteriaceae bacterium]MCY4216612.1 hypothetical protein [Flavobacteriaceae bacterium]